MRTLLLALSVSMAGILSAADPLEELRDASSLKEVSAPKLLRGEIFAERGTQGNFTRGAYAESCYYVKASVAAVGNTLLHWDPSKYKEAEVDVYQTYRWPVPADVFKKIQLATTRSTDRSLIDWTLAAERGEKGTLHLRAADEDLLRQNAAGHDLNAPGARLALVNTTWRQILQQRSEAMAQGGFAGVPPYQVGDVAIRAANEFGSLLKMAPRIAARFEPLTGAKPLFAGGANTADEVVPYAEQSQVNGHTSLGLGVMAARKTPGTWQVFDCTYYTADTYFLSLSLYQLWPWENGTLVWQVDYVSAPFRSYLGGLDRVFAGKEITKDSAQAVRLFRREAESAAR